MWRFFVAKTRLILLALMFMLIVGGFAIHLSNMEFVLKIVAGIAGGLLFSSALVLMGITFFVLDEQGRIPHGSLAWRFFADFHKKTEKTPEGKEIQVARMPERLKLCPAYWMIVLGLLGLSFAVLIAGVVVYLIGLFFIYGPPTDSGAKASLATIAVFAAFVTIVVGVSHLLIKFNKYLLLKIWWYFVAFIVFGGIIALAMSVNMNKDMTAGQAAVEVVIGFVWIVLGIAAVITAMVGVVAALVGIIFTAIKIFPWVRDSLIGRLIAAMYRGLCPVIQLAPAPVPAVEQPSE